MRISDWSSDVCSSDLFPPVPAQRDTAFRAWFAWSNEQLRDSAGLAGRRLLRGADGAYVGLVEHASAATFAQMHASPAASEVQQQLRSEERRVGQEWVSSCKLGWSRVPTKKKQN